MTGELILENIVTSLTTESVRYSNGEQKLIDIYENLIKKGIPPQPAAMLTIHSPRYSNFEQESIKRYESFAKEGINPIFAAKLTVESFEYNNGYELLLSRFKNLKEKIKKITPTSIIQESLMLINPPSKDESSKDFREYEEQEKSNYTLGGAIAGGLIDGVEGAIIGGIVGGLLSDD